MSQVAYTTGQSALTLQSLITRAKLGNVSEQFLLDSAQLTLASYAKDYAGNYYQIPAQGSAPTAFPSVESALTNGSFYEIAFPSDAQESGIQSIEILWDTSNLKIIDQTLINWESDETSWDTTSANTTKVYCRMAGRKIRVYVPAAYVSVTPKYTIGYKRLPTYPGTVSDILDVPVEDFVTFYRAWQQAA